MRLPEIEVAAYGGNRACVSWKDASRNYHIWLDVSGKAQDDVLHSNPIREPADRRVNGHRALSQRAKKWAPVIAAIVSTVNAGNLIAKAIEQAEARDAAEHAERLRKAQATDLAQLDRAIKHLPPTIGATLRALPEDVRLAFVSALNA